MSEPLEVKYRCVYCSRYLMIKAIESAKIIIRCSDRKCKKDNEVKIVMMSDYVRGAK